MSKKYYVNRTIIDYTIYDRPINENLAGNFNDWNKALTWIDCFVDSIRSQFDDVQFFRLGFRDQYVVLSRLIDEHYYMEVISLEEV